MTLKNVRKNVIFCNFCVALNELFTRFDFLQQYFQYAKDEYETVERIFVSFWKKNNRK